MKLLLDSPVLVYVADSPESLPAKARAAIDDACNDVFVSMVTGIELQIKINPGKLQFAKPLRQVIEEDIADGMYRLLPIKLVHVDQLARLPDVQRDPFDRLLIAQAIVENLTIVASDQHIRRYPVPTLWD